jgi:hypothetical protein
MAFDVLQTAIERQAEGMRLFLPQLIPPVVSPLARAGQGVPQRAPGRTRVPSSTTSGGGSPGVRPWALGCGRTTARPARGPAAAGP